LGSNTHSTKELSADAVRVDTFHCNDKDKVTGKDQSDVINMDQTLITPGDCCNSSICSNVQIYRIPNFRFGTNLVAIW
jgi:hypothetical protein